jgi:hypothetical protein
MIRLKLAVTRPIVFNTGLKRSLIVATKLALKCGDYIGAVRFDEEQRGLDNKYQSIKTYPATLDPATMSVPATTTTQRLLIPRISPMLSSTYTLHTALNQVILLGMRSRVPGSLAS